MGRRQRPARATSTKLSRKASMERAQWIIGLGLTAIVIALWANGATAGLDEAASDARARLVGFSSPPPSDAIVLVGVDDSSLDTLSWPLPRAAWAEVVRELDNAGARVIAFDVLFDQEQGGAAWPPGAPTAGRDDHRALADAIAHHGRVVLAARFGVPSEDRREGDAVTRVPFSTVLEIVSASPGVPESELFARVIERSASEDLAREIELGDAPVLRDLRLKVEAARALVVEGARSSRRVPDEGERAWIESESPRPPIARLSAAAARLGNVSFVGGDARLVPLWARAGGQVYPSLGVQAAALFLSEAEGARPRLSGHETLVPGAAVALELERSRRESAGLLHRVVWPRPTVDWASRSMRGPLELFQRDGDAPPATVSVGRLLDPAQLRARLQTRVIATIDTQLAALAAGGLARLPDPAAYEQRAVKMDDPTLPLDDWLTLVEAQTAAWDQVHAGAAQMWEMVEQGLPDGADPKSTEPFNDFDDPTRRIALYEVVTRFPDAIKVVREGVARINVWRDVELPAIVGGKLCFVGWVATGNIDMIATSVHERTPGVLVHMAIANELLAGHTKRPAPWWLAMLVTAALGLIGTNMALRLPVAASPIALVALGLIWSAANAVLIWDAADLDIPLATPMAAAIVSWLGVMMHHLLIEQRSRRQTEARFRSYVPADVVDILVANPALDSMLPQRRELTIMFADIAGFTTLAERLGTARTAEVLAIYLARMTEVLESNKATIDKFLGDGIMAFWGAPIADEAHARNAALAALGMLDALDQLNDTNAFGADVAGLTMRIGLAAGEVSVGDFGNPPHKSAYTVIGDSVNLSARLESACKQLGTRTLISGRVRELMGEGITVRPLGRIIVQGKVEPEWIGELIGDRKPHGDKTADWIALSEALTSEYAKGDFAGAEACADRLEREFSDSALAAVYRASILENRGPDGGPREGFDSAIRLSQK